MRLFIREQRRGVDQDDANGHPQNIGYKTCPPRNSLPSLPSQVAQQDDSQKQSSNESTNVCCVARPICFFYTVALINRKPKIGENDNAKDDGSNLKCLIDYK